MRELAKMRMQGKGVVKDVSKAIELYEKAAELGDAASMCALGDLYSEKGSVPGDIRDAINCDKEAFKWYKKAMENGSEYGKIQTAIGYFFHQGDEKESVKSERKAHRLFLQLANANGQHSAWAERCIGCIHERGGAGTTKDKEKALEWYEKSAKHGDELGLKELERLEGELFDAETVAERRAERAKAAGQEILTDISALLAKADRMKDKTFVLKGFYLGMSVDEAAVLARHYLPKANVVVTGGNDIEIDVVHKKEFDVQPMFFCRADDKHMVWQFNFDKRFLEQWFKYDVQTCREWAEAFGRENGFRFVRKCAEGKNTGIAVSQEYFASTDAHKKFTIAYFGEKSVFDPHAKLTLEAMTANPLEAGKIEGARAWVNNGWENDTGAREGTLRLELIK